MNPDDKTLQNKTVQEQAKDALQQQELAAYQKKLEAKRAARAKVSAVGLDNPFDIPENMKDPRFHYMIVNDSPGRVNMFQARGYELVTDKALALYLNQRAGEPIKFATGMNNPAWAYLMKIEKELFEEDMKAEQDAAEAKFQALGIAPDDLKFAKDANIEGVHLQKESTL